MDAFRRYVAGTRSGVIRRVFKSAREAWTRDARIASFRTRLRRLQTVAFLTRQWREAYQATGRDLLFC